MLGDAGGEDFTIISSIAFLGLYCQRYFIKIVLDMCSLLDWGAALKAATCLLMQGTKYVSRAKF